MITSEKVYKAYTKKRNKMSPRELDIIERYYGLGGYMVHTQREIAELYQITTERIRQIRMIALNKLGIWPE